jgi:hypothetical protein
MNTIPFLPVLGAGVAAFLLGWAWYSKILFQKPWMASLGITDADYEKVGKPEAFRTMVYGFLTMLATAYGVAVLLTLLEPASLTEALAVSLFACFAFSITLEFSRMIYESKDPHWSRGPQVLFLISSGWQMVQFSAITTVLWFTLLS